MEPEIFLDTPGATCIIALGGGSAMELAALSARLPGGRSATRRWNVGTGGTQMFPTSLSLVSKYLGEVY